VLVLTRSLDRAIPALCTDIDVVQSKTVSHFLAPRVECLRVSGVRHDRISVPTRISNLSLCIETRSRGLHYNEQVDWAGTT